MMQQANIQIRNLAMQLKESGNERVIIYPYGYYGQIAARLLEDVYGIHDIVRVDNNLSKINKEIAELGTVKNPESRKYFYIISK